MTFDKASKIFERWQQYQEIHTKLISIFSIIPESFLPYPSDELEEALNIIAKHFFDSGNHEMSKVIETSKAGLFCYLADEEALTYIERRLASFSQHSDIKDTYLASLKRAKDSWTEQHDTN